VQTAAEAPAAPASPQAITDGTTPAAIYQGLTEKARVLREQLDAVVEERSTEISGLREMSGGDMAPARAIVTERIARLDKRIAGLEEQVAQADAQVASAAAVPGAIAPRYRDTGASDEDLAGMFFGGATTMLVLSLLWVFFKRWRQRRRGIKNPRQAAVPNEIAARMERLEAVAEATALEVERIGEGQRFVTKLLSEQKVAVRNQP
jgi:hypothetical protein